MSAPANLLAVTLVVIGSAGYYAVAARLQTWDRAA